MVFSLFNPSYLPPLKFVEVVRVLQIALSGVSIFTININEHVGICPSTEHVTSEDAHFIGVDCQTIQGMNYSFTLSHMWAKKLCQIKPCMSTASTLSTGYKYVPINIEININGANYHSYLYMSGYMLYLYYTCGH